MPNICSAEVMIRGYHSNVDAFINTMNTHYNYNDEGFLNNPHRHFYRIFECYVIDEWYDGLIKTAVCSIECAWSVYVCMFNGPQTYYDDCKDMEVRFHTHIQEEARRLGVLVEIYSEEDGVGFQEHYIVNNNGNIAADECVDFNCIYTSEYDTYEECKEDFPDVTREQYDLAKPNGIIESGGFDWDYHIDSYVPMAYKIMAKKVKKND